MTGRRVPSRDQGGFSLVDSVVAIAVLGLIVAAMVGGLATTIATSDIHRQQSEANTVLVSAAEIVKHSDYLSCASTYPVPGIALPSALWSAAVVVSVRSWDAPSASWDNSCHDNDGITLFQMQLVTVTVTDPGNRATVKVDFVKRKP